MFRRLGCRIKVGTVTALLALGAAACASSGGSGASNPSSPGSGGGAVSGKTLTLGVVADVTGLMSPVSGPTLYAMEAAIAAAKLPVVGDGDSPNWSGRPYIYSISGNLITQNTTAWAKVLISQGRTRIGVPGGTINAAATVTWEHLVPFAGGKLCFGRVGINGANTASLVAVAHEIIAAHCQGIINPTLYPGTEALQAALNQLGANIPEVEAGDLGPAITSQYGSSVNNMIYANFFASPYDTSDPGVAQYLAAMAKYEPGKQVDCFCIKGYPIVQWFLHSFGQIKGTPTQAKLVAALESTHGYTANGLVPPVQEPAFHTVGSVCLSYSIIKNGQWTSLIKGPNPFICGQRFSYTGK
jgi:hypothetical protein